MPLYLFIFKCKEERNIDLWMTNESKSDVPLRSKVFVTFENKSGNRL